MVKCGRLGWLATTNAENTRCFYFHSHKCPSPNWSFMAAFWKMIKYEHTDGSCLMNNGELVRIFPGNTAKCQSHFWHSIFASLLGNYRVNDHKRNYQKGRIFAVTMPKYYLLKTKKILYKGWQNGRLTASHLCLKIDRGEKIVTISSRISQFSMSRKMSSFSIYRIWTRKKCRNALDFFTFAFLSQEIGDKFIFWNFFVMQIKLI